MLTHESHNRPGRALRAVVVLVLLAMLLGAWLWMARPGAPAPQVQPAKQASEAESQPVMLEFTVARIAAAAESQPAVGAFLHSIGAAPGNQAGPVQLQSWFDQLDGLVAGGLASIESRPKIAVLSGQEAALHVTAQTPGSASKLIVTATPRVGPASATTLDLDIKSSHAEGALELWAKDVGLSLGPSASVGREVRVAPGGGAGLVAAARTPLRHEGWIVVIVKPSVMPASAPPIAPAPTAAPSDQP